MTPAQFTEARKSLGLSTAETAAVLGRTVRNIQQWESGARAIDPSAARLMVAYQAGYRPDDWITNTRE